MNYYKILYINEFIINTIIFYMYPPKTVFIGIYYLHYCLFVLFCLFVFTTIL